MIETPTHEDVDEALSDVDDLIDRIGDQVNGNVNEQTEQGMPVKGRQVQHGGHGYHVLASPQFAHIKLQAGFDAAEMLAANQAIAQADGPQVQVTDASLQSAQNKLRDRADKDLGTIREELINRVSVDEKVVQLNADEEFVSGFQVTTRLFMYDESVSVAKFNDEVQALINVLWRGKAYLMSEYNLQGGGSDDGEDLPGFA